MQQPNQVEMRAKPPVNQIAFVKIIECEMLLNEQDIQEYRDAVEVEPGRVIPGCSIPVWVEAFGAFFYVNKISNFGAKPLTKVELWKL